MSEDLIVDLSGVRRRYQVGDHVLEVLRGVNYQVHRGEWAALLGASGSGKTTLLHLIGALEKPDAGSIRVCGAELSDLNRHSAAVFRRNKLGFVFQAYHLLPELSIRENVMLPALLGNCRKREAMEKAEALLIRVGLKERLAHRPNELSGGEQQRAAIARALINEPELLLADEPTGNLDSRTGGEILELFASLRENGPLHSIIMITHNREITGFCNTVSELKDGII